MADLSAIGGAVGDIFGGVGDFAEAGAYDEAAKLAQQNAGIVKLSTGIKQEANTRQGYQVIGATEAATGANGMALSGSSMDVLKSNAQQITLQKSLTAEQGQIDVNAWEEKASADQGMASAAQAGGAGGILGGALKLAGGLTVICTELMRQGRVPKRWYLEGAKASLKYHPAAIEGYHLWAVPSVRHLRAHPNSLYSRFLEIIFTWYLQNLAAKGGVHGVRPCWRGAVLTAIIYRTCFAVGWVRLSLKRLTDWEGLYRA